MLSPEEIAEQQELLDTYRRTLAVYLRQQAEIGRAYSPRVERNAGRGRARLRWCWKVRAGNSR